MTKTYKNKEQAQIKGAVAKLIKASVSDDPFECPFKNDKERLKYMKQHYSNMSIAEQFATYYGEEIPEEVKKSRNVNNPVNIEGGGIYKGTVTEITNRGIYFSVTGVSEEVYSKENFSDCMDAVKNYLLNHNNELMFTVIEKKNGKYLVSVLSAYYRSWQRQIEKAIEQHNAITVHIDSLVRGGYMCHTDIWTISELTGKTYTSTVFIPGSNIVLNIEKDFERWLGQDVQAIPQKFTKFRSYGRPAENSLMASRKMALKIIGMKNMYEMYTRAKLAERADVKYEPERFEGVVTGIINSNKNTGIFVELEEQCITGLMPVNSASLLNYKPGDKVYVYVDKFEVMPGKDPFYIDKKSIIRACNVRPVFAPAL